MTVHEKIGGLLDTLSLPYYARMPTFAAGEEPELYIVYTIDNRVKSRSDGKINALEYTVTLNVFGRDETAVDEETVSCACATVVVMLLFSEGLPADVHPEIDIAEAHTIAAMSRFSTTQM